jgi:hypothetical protein
MRFAMMLRYRSVNGRCVYGFSSPGAGMCAIVTDPLGLPAARVSSVGGDAQ